MFWMSLLLAALALVFFKLGALSVVTAVLSGGLLAALLVIACFVIVLMWRHLFRSKV
jgi:hypothetical protein